MKLLFVLVRADGTLTQQDKDIIRDKGSARNYQIIVLEQHRTHDCVAEAPSTEVWQRQLGVPVHAAFTVGPRTTPEDLWGLLRRYSSDESPKFYRCEHVLEVSYALNIARIKSLIQ